MRVVLKIKGNLIRLILIMAVFFSCVSCSNTFSGAETTVFDSVETDQDVMDAIHTLEPPATNAPKTAPVVSEPVVTEPIETAPQESIPEETTPPETVPPTTEPPATAPQETEPPATEPPHNHSYSVSGTVAPSCESQGYTTYVCSCGASYSDNHTAALGHSYFSTVVAATTESEGYTEHVCSQCGSSYRDSYTEKLPAPVVTLNYAAAEAYGNQYAVSAYGWTIDTTLNADNAGYYPATTGSVQGFVERGGQADLNSRVASKVDSLVSNLSDRGITLAYINCDVYDDGNGKIYILVYYG